MRPDDMPAFQRELSGLAGVLGRRLHEDVVVAYFRGLQDLDLDVLVRVLRKLVRTAESGARLPTPGEIRQRAGGSVNAPDAPLSDIALDRVRQAVLTALNSWEQVDGNGTARPTFERAWKAARQREGWGGTVQQREQLWQDWLAGGMPLTREAMRDLLTRANSRRKPGTRPLELGPLGAVVRNLRDPGEEG